MSGGALSSRESATRDQVDGRRPDLGHQAESPTEIPAKGWWQILRRSLKEFGNDHLSLVAKGVAYSWFMALFPGLVAAVSIYGLVTTPEEVKSQVASLSSSLPDSAQTLITTQLQSLAGASGGALSIGLVVSIALALWSASAGMSGLVEALNIAYDEEEERNFVIKRGLALLLTVGFIAFFGIAIGLIAVFPFLADEVGGGLAVQVLLEILRWVLLVAIAIVALGMLYRVGPDRDAPAVKWLSLGSIASTVLWVVASLGFAFYVDNFGSYAKTYGALAGVVVLLLWFWITAMVVLIGAEVNAETEGQTAKDTTKGEPAPLGRRGAVKADETPPPA
jgi:membrane protein